MKNIIKKAYSYIIILIMVMLFFGTMFIFMLNTIQKLGTWNRLTGIEGLMIINNSGESYLADSLSIAAKLDILNHLANDMESSSWPALQTIFQEQLKGNSESIKLDELSDEALKELYSLQIVINHEIEMQWRGIKFLLSIFFFITLIMLILIFYTIYVSMKEQTEQNLDQSYQMKMIQILEKERNLLAYNLHDEIAQALVFIKTYLSSENPQYREAKRETALEMSVEVLAAVRNLSQSLRAPNQKEGSHQDILQGLCEDMKELCSVDIHYQFVGMRHLHLPEDNFLQVYRITQELINNGCKHSQGTRLEIRFLLSHPTLIINYSDDGIGINSELLHRRAEKGHLGIPGIEYRTRMLNGKCTFSNGLDKGTMIRIEIPLKEEI